LKFCRHENRTDGDFPRASVMNWVAQWVSAIERYAQKSFAMVQRDPPWMVLSLVTGISIVLSIWPMKSLIMLVLLTSK
jgi:hypothetical protein